MLVILTILFCDSFRHFLNRKDMFSKVLSGRKTLKLFHLSILICLFMFVVYIQISKHYQRKMNLSSPKPRRELNSDKRYFVMLWGEYEKRNFIYKSHSTQEFVPYEYDSKKLMVRPRACSKQYPNCFLTQDRKKYRNATVFVFNLHDIDLTRFPLEREHHQMWILYDMSLKPSVAFYPTCDTDFHMLAGYSTKYDLHIPYGRLVKAQNSNQLESFNYNPKSAVLWIVTECSSIQSDYVRRLQKQIRVDIIGSKCNNSQLLRCPNKQLSKCLKDIMKSYQFLLAFEDHLCPDFIPYHAWNAFKSNLIPIVLLQNETAKALPANSFVNAHNFGSPEELGEYLNVLKRKPEELRKFHMWKMDHSVDTDYNANEHLFCEACHIAHQIKTNPNYKMPSLKLLSNIYQERSRRNCPLIH